MGVCAYATLASTQNSARHSTSASREECSSGEKSLTMLRGSSRRASRRLLLSPTCREVPCCSAATETLATPEHMRWRDGKEYSWPLDNLRMLKARQMIAHTYPQDLLTKKYNHQRYESAPTVYAGFDATGDSLHVGSLMIINSLLHLAQLNWTIIFLIGDATARLGDPSGHTEDRSILRRENVEANSESIARQLRTMIDNYQDLFAHKAGRFLCDFVHGISSPVSGAQCAYNAQL